MRKETMRKETITNLVRGAEAVSARIGALRLSTTLNEIAYG